ncbi:MAG: glycosyl hydrolase family 95 catalytic domain-containing protein, partial [Oscillospiraceae bacterium]
PEPEIGQYGQIMEWAEDYDEVEPGHRHISQLFALYPGEMITPEKTPDLAQAAQATIERRLSHGGGHTGWSRAWIINMWARLGNGEKVGENIAALLSYSTAISMLDMHPPFQIDGNFGGGAGIAEAIMQSHSSEIKLIPAVPAHWSSGSVSAMRARGGFEVSFEWQDGKVTVGSILSNAGGTCRICGKYFITENGQPVNMTYQDNVTIFETSSGKSYKLENMN